MWDRFLSRICVKWTCWTERTGRPVDQANQKSKTKQKRRPRVRTERPVLFRNPGKWLQEFRENLVDERVPERRDSHASSSHEPSLEPTPTRSADLGKHSICTHVPKDRNCEICQTTKITRAPCRRRNRGVYLVQKILVIWSQQITRSSVTIANLETTIDMQSWCRTWLPNGSSRIRAKQKLLRKHKGACKSSWSRIGILKSFTLTIPWNLAKPVKIFPGIIVRRHHTGQKAPLQYCCNQDWMKIGGHILWNAIPICETFKISCLMGKVHTRDVLGNHLKDRTFRLVHWLSITPSLRKTSQVSINLERKSFLDCSLDTLCTWGEFGRVTHWLQTLGSWKRWTLQKSTLKGWMLKK